MNDNNNNNDDNNIVNNSNNKKKIKLTNMNPFREQYMQKMIESMEREARKREEKSTSASSNDNNNIPVFTNNILPPLFLMEENITNIRNISSKQLNSISSFTDEECNTFRKQLQNNIIENQKKNRQEKEKEEEKKEIPHPIPNFTYNELKCVLFWRDYPDIKDEEQLTSCISVDYSRCNAKNGQPVHKVEYDSVVATFIQLMSRLYPFNDIYTDNVINNGADKLEYFVITKQIRAKIVEYYNQWHKFKLYSTVITISQIISISKICFKYFYHDLTAEDIDYVKIELNDITYGKHIVSYDNIAFSASKNKHLPALVKQIEKILWAKIIWDKTINARFEIIDDGDSNNINNIVGNKYTIYDRRYVEFIAFYFKIWRKASSYEKKMYPICKDVFNQHEDHSYISKMDRPIKSAEKRDYKICLIDTNSYYVELMDKIQREVFTPQNGNVDDIKIISRKPEERKTFTSVSIDVLKYIVQTMKHLLSKSDTDKDVLLSNNININIWDDNDNINNDDDDELPELVDIKEGEINDNQNDNNNNNIIKRVYIENGIHNVMQEEINNYGIGNDLKLKRQSEKQQRKQKQMEWEALKLKREEEILKVKRELFEKEEKMKKLEHETALIWNEKERLSTQESILKRQETQRSWDNEYIERKEEDAKIENERIEKEQLLYKQNREERKKQKKQLEKQKEEDLERYANEEGPNSVCVICMSARSKVVMVPCGHKCICVTCSNNKGLKPTCPVCRADSIMSKEINNLCIKCNKNPKGIIFTPCGHVCYCNTCNDNYPDVGGCPICLKTIVYKTKIFY